MSFTGREQVIDRRSLLRYGGATLAVAGATRGSRAAQSEVVVGQNGWLFPAFDQVTRADFTRLHDGASLINDAVRILKTGGIETVICLTPAKSRIYSEFLPPSVTFSNDARRRYGYELDELRHQGTIVPDLADAMLKERKAEPNAQLFFKGDTHWTPQGARCAAEAIAGVIKGKSLLPSSATPGPRLGSPRDAMQSKNDLAYLLPLEARGRYPLEAYKLPQAEEASGDLLSEDGADTVLVGNSYLHPSFGFSVMLSSFLNRPVWLVWKIHAFSPYWNLLDYLGSSAFKAQRPKLLVWVFHETDLTIPPNNSAIWGQTAMKHDDILGDLRRKLAV